MDVMMRLKGAGFSAIANEFRQREKRLGGGLPLHDFVEIVLRGLPKPTSEAERAANISALIDLFEDIDINGDGAMEFDEFTSYCVDAGMVATRAAGANLKHRYVRFPRRRIKTTNGSIGVEKVRWSALFQRFLVIEHTAKSVKLFNVEGKMVAEVRALSTFQVPTPSSPQSSTSEVDDLHGAKNYRRSRAAEASESMTASVAAANANPGIFILDAAFIHKFQCLALSTTDFVISFYSMEEPRHQRAASEFTSIVIGPTYDVIPKLTITTTTAQLTLRFSEEAGLLFSSGNDFVVNVWKITDLENKVLWKRLLNHQEMVMDVVEVPAHDMIASCDLNRTIHLWDIHDCRLRGSLLGHTHGIKQMVYSKDHDLLLSAGFEFDAYGWDLASRQTVLKLVGHHAPLVGVQLAVFQTERAVTVDASGVIKVWDISRGSGGIQQGSTMGKPGLDGGGRGATHAVQLESVDCSHHLSRFEPTSFMCLHPDSRDLWITAAGSATLHLFRSTRVQQFDDIPLKAFYHYNANRFIVVCGPVCSVWDGETGSCVDEFRGICAGQCGTDGRRLRDHSAAEGNGNNHNGMGSGPGMDPSTDILLCAHDAKCKKIVLVAEDGEMGVFNCHNFMPMRRCEEQFCGRSSSIQETNAPTCGLVGLHYCSENKLVIATDSTSNAIIVIDDNSSDSANGIKETKVLRRLIQIPDGVATSAYSYHASMIATLDETNGTVVSLWDFESLILVGECHLSNVNNAALGLLEFWDEFPVLLASDYHGLVYFFAVMPTKYAKTGGLLHAFVNHQDVSSREDNDTEIRSEMDEKEDGEAGDSRAKPNGSNTFMTEVTESAAKKFLTRRRKGKTRLNPSNSIHQIKTQNPAAAVMTMKVVFDDDENRYLLFTGDERGAIRVWDLSKLMRRLSLFKIPEAQCKYMRRGYHPRAMFSRDYSKEIAMKRDQSRDMLGSSMLNSRELAHSKNSLLLARDEISAAPNQVELKKLLKKRQDGKKKSSVSTGPNQWTKYLPPNRVSSGHAPPPVNAVAAAEAFLGSQQRNSSTGSVGRGASLKSANDGNLILSRSTYSEMNVSDCLQHEDVSLLWSWGAHTDGITSLEVSKHPNIIVTCSLDMRVYIWDWKGGCLGKLFDFENLGCRWRFRHDDTKRVLERQALIQDLIQELDMTPQQKAHRRRQTLYQEHIQRKSVKDLPHLSSMLLDHVVSQDPEVTAMEKQLLFTDETINAELEKQRKRNYQKKLSMLKAMKRSVPGQPNRVGSVPGQPKGVGSTMKQPVKDTVAVGDKKQGELRMKSLAQVGPLLCIDQFEHRNEFEQMRFAEKEELKMDRQYLEDELAMTVPYPAVSSIRANMAQAGGLELVRRQIQQTQKDAEEKLNNKIGLQRRAVAMYTNMQLVKNRTAMSTKRVTQTCPESALVSSIPNLNETETEIAKLLEPSEFLKKRLPLTTNRPHTAPNVQSTSKLALKHIRSPESSVSLTNCTTDKLSSSASDSSLLTRQRPKAESLKPGSNQSTIEAVSTKFQTGQSPSHRTSSKKLDGINNIIDQAQSFCDQAVEANNADHQQPWSATQTTKGHSNTDRSRARKTLPALAESEDVSRCANSDNSYNRSEESIRERIEVTRRRMEIAMTDNERGSPSHRSLINRKRHEIEQVKKEKRMEEYLQQKRRELNTNIGSVFKRTSFAFQSREGDTERSGVARGLSTEPSQSSEALQAIEKSKVFGIYAVKEVMSVIRLFWTMDEDGSGHLTLPELLAYKSFFEKLGYHDMTTVFQAIDKDGSGAITLKELLEICFHYANKFQIEEMLKLAKIGNISTYLAASSPGRQNSMISSNPRSAAPEDSGDLKRQPALMLSPENRAELMAIFSVFDRDGDGTVSFHELLEALHVDEDEAMARVTAAEEAHLSKRAHKGTTRSRVISNVGLTKDDVRKLFEEVDSDGNRTLDFEEFVLLMQAVYGPTTSQSNL